MAKGSDVLEILAEKYPEVYSIITSEADQLGVDPIEYCAKLLYDFILSREAILSKLTVRDFIVLLNVFEQMQHKGITTAVFTMKSFNDEVLGVYQGIVKSIEEKYKKEEVKEERRELWKQQFNVFEIMSNIVTPLINSITTIMSGYICRMLGIPVESLQTSSPGAQSSAGSTETEVIIK